MSMLDQLKQYEVRRYDYRTGTLRDLSPNAIVTDPTATGCLWNTSEKGRSLRIKSATSRLDYGAVDPIGTGNITVVAMFRTDVTDVARRLFDQGKTQLSLHSPATQIRIVRDGSTVTAISAANSIVADKTIVVAATSTSAGVSNLYINGTQSGTRNLSAGTPAAATTNFFVGNRNASDAAWNGSIYYLAVYNTILTEQQISQISDELMNEKTVTIPSIQSDNKGVNLCCDGNMERADTDFWTSINSAVITKATTAPKTGKQCLRVAYFDTNNPAASQTSLTVGKFYRLTGWARGDGAVAPNIYFGDTLAWTGTSSASWQSIDAIKVCAGTGALKLLCPVAGAGYSEFDDIKVVEVPSLTSYDAIPKKAYIDNGGIGWNRSFGNENSGELSNTGWRIYSGTWQVKNQGDADETKKQIVCVGSGIIYRYAPFAYGTWKWDMYKGGAVTQPEFMPFATNFNGRGDASCNGYTALLGSSENVRLASITASSVALIISSAASYIPETGWFSVMLKRYAGGLGKWYMYIKGGTFTTWTLVSVAGGSGTNPVNDNTFTSGMWMSFDIDSLDIIKNMSFTPDYNVPVIDGNI